MVLTATPKKQREFVFPTKQKNHKYINKAIDQWLDIHFGDTSFNGRVVLGHRKPKSDAILPLKSCLLTELPHYMKLIHVSSRLDYYITANTVTGQNRLNENLFGLHNIVIDVDCHNDNHPHAVPQLVEAFIWRSKHDLWEGGIIPAPNSIVRTGRGVQFWWAIKPCYGGKGYDKSRYHHDKIKNTFMDHIEAMLDQYKEEMGGLNIDRGASGNLVGYFRLPCTYNTKAKCYSSLEILHTKRYDQRELTWIESPSVGTRRVATRKTTKYVPMLESDRFILRSFQSTGVCRVIQLINLRNLRNNEAGSEMRDYFNFSVYNALRMSFDHKQAMGRLKAFNSGFKKPMTDRELENCVSSAAEKDGYSYSNAKLIELLEITSEEQEAIGLFPTAKKRRSKPNASRDTARMALKEDRDQKIIELHKQGISQAETARILGIGKNTVWRVLKRLQDTPEMSIVEEYDRHQNGSIYVLNDSADHVVPESPLEIFEDDEDGLFVLGLADSS